MVRKMYSHISNYFLTSSKNFLFLKYSLEVTDSYQNGYVILIHIWKKKEQGTDKVSNLPKEVFSDLFFLAHIHWIVH